MSKIFDQTIMPLSKKMQRYAASILGNDQNARDVVQDCLLKIWNKRDMLKEIENKEAWVMRITRNHCLDFVKVNRFSLSSLETLEMESTIGSDDQLLIKDQGLWLEKILTHMPLKQKEVFHLREIECLSYQEMAEVLGIQVNEVKVLLHRARTKIKETMMKIESYGVAN